jgi:hypothetical protein
MSDPPSPICVIGFGRSGTSATARVLNLLGVDLGPAETLAPAWEPDNARGYWEPLWMIELNDSLLAAAGGTWDNPPALPPGWREDQQWAEMRERARAMTEERLGRARGPWGWKDPRTTLLLPFWRSIYPDAGFVICVRAPQPAVKSLKRRGNDDRLPADWGRVWHDYSMRAFRDTRGAPRIVVFYDDLVAHPDREVRRLARFLRCDMSPTTLRAAAASIEPNLRHHSVSIREVMLDASMPLRHRLLYLYLRARHATRLARL